MDTDVNYTFTITNTGTYDLTNIMLSDPKLGISDLAIPDLAVGAQPYTTTVAFDLGNISYGDWISNVFTNTASVNAKYFKLSKDSVGADCVDPGKSIGPISSSATVTYIPPEPGLTFTKTVDSTVVSSMAATVYYTFTVTNTGECDLRNIEINDDALHIVGLAIPDLDVGDLPYTTTVAFDLEDLDLGDWDGYSFTNIASVTADYGSVLDLTLIRPIDGGQLGPITASAIVTYMPGTLTIYKDVPEVTEDATPFTFVVTEIVYYETASTFFVNEYIPFTTTVAVSENSPYTIYGLPDGQYQVEELTPPAYYTVSGSAIQNVYIGDNGYNQSVTFTNNYYVPPTTTTTTTTRRTRTTTEVVVPEPTPAGPVVTPEVILDEPVLPAAPLPQTGGLDPGFLYGLGALLAGSGLVLRKRKVN
jgi:LPXTG-motif cell wall-anchored protein